MSFYSDASLVMIPSGYKDQKVYCAVPTDGSADLTFSRASSATRVQSDGLIEKVRTNTLLQSETFDNATWSKQNSSVVSNSIAAPNGTTTADSLIPANAINVFSGVFVSNTTPAIKTFSFYVKKGSKRYVLLLGYTGVSNCWFDLDDGVVGTRGADFSASSITAVGNGWYRVSAVFSTAIGGLSNLGLYASDADNSNVCTGDGTTVALYLWGAQVETGDIATDYIATTTAAVSVGPVSGLPRLDYLGSTCPRLLLEPQRTNLITFSEQLNNAAWLNAGGTTTANTAISPTGYQDADTLTGARYQSSFGSNTYTLSAFAKKVDGDGTFVLRVDVPANKAAVFNLNNGTIVSTDAGYTSTITSYGNGWYRCTLTTPASTTISNAVIVSANAGVSSTFVYGCQLEAGAYATSYIPTLGASVTRVADDCGKTSISSLIGQTEGTFFIDMQFEAYDNLAKWIAFLGTGNSYIGFYTDTISRFVAEVSNGGTAQFASQTLTFVVGQRYKLALAYKANDFAFYVNGAQIATDNSGTVPATSQFSLQYNTTANNLTARTYNQALLFTTRLTNAQLAELTA
jgi:hypothetical protein